MCARYNLRISPQKLAQIFDVVREIEFTRRYNIAPTQSVVAIRRDAAGQRSTSMLRWGLIPFWAKDPKAGPPLLNAKAETVAAKPAFRAAFKARRCLIPASGFYEWQKAGKDRLPFHIHMPDDEPFAFAGLWETWGPKDAAPLESCVMLTTSANSQMSTLHDRMPVILHRHDYDTWLDPEIKDPASLWPLLQPWDERLALDPVAKTVNNSRNEGEECLTSDPTRTPL